MARVSLRLRVGVVASAVFGLLAGGLVVPSGAFAAAVAALAPAASRPVGQLGLLPSDSRMPLRKSVTGSGVVPAVRPTPSLPGGAVPAPPGPKGGMWNNWFTQAVSVPSARGISPSCGEW